ncbi:hypothetical protein MUK42_31133 [Musa troglodytarum]|uniref:Uncharacterized protein n=1 Tax=Musa troglodytarum TaxID=320322 RepID=A0A9E7EZ56_9LILI|nr:hypothetical protein MUK42_31133 [Musa troglodytarum]
MLAEVVVPTEINELVGVPQSSAYLYCLSSRPSLIGLSPHCGQWWLSNNICKLVVLVVAVVVRKENSETLLLFAKGVSRGVQVGNIEAELD